jgi:hypothetical protein
MSPDATALDSAAPRIDADNPWPGLLSFSEQDSGFFKGRDHETEDLFRFVLRERLTVLYGISGLGKSSLLQAGLFPRLRPENIFPVYLRLDFSAASPDLVGQVLGSMVREAERITALPDAQRIEAPGAKPGETLWEYLHRHDNDFWNERNRPLMPALVFDQFEEIFTLGRQDASRKAASADFLEQLADLVEGRPPARLRAWIDQHPDEAGAFDFDRHYYKVLLGIREDYLPELETLRTSMPRVALNRLRLRRMNGEAALLVVNQAARLFDDNVPEPKVPERIVRFVAADQESPLKELQIEPALLSVFCSELNNKRKENHQDKITPELLQGSQQQVIADFYERSTRDLAPEVRTFIEDHLLTVSGFRDSVALENALGMGISEETIKKLVDRRLVRQEDRGGSKRLELTHDLLASVVRASRDARRQREAAEEEKAALLAEQERQRQALLKAQEEERRRLEKAQELERQARDKQELQRIRKYAIASTALAILAVVMACWAIAARRQAQLDRDAAVLAEQQAQHDKTVIQQQLQDVQSAYSPALRNNSSASPPGYFDVQRPVSGGGFRQREPAVTRPGGETYSPPPPPPPVAAAAPRIFVQYVNQQDKAKATALASVLQSKGYAVQPLQYVPQAAALTHSDVRYYRDDDAAEAAKILKIVQDAGQSSARMYIPSGQKENPNVRPNTFEVWLANSNPGGGPAQVPPVINKN